MLAVAGYQLEPVQLNEVADSATPGINGERGDGGDDYAAGNRSDRSPQNAASCSLSSPENDTKTDGG